MELGHVVDELERIDVHSVINSGDQRLDRLSRVLDEVFSPQIERPLAAVVSMPCPQSNL